MARVRKRGKNFVLDYRLNGKRERERFTDRAEAEGLCEKFNLLKRADRLSEFKALLGARQAMIDAEITLSGKSLADSIEEYGKTCSRHKSEQTAKNEKTDFKKLFEFLSGERDVHFIREVTPQMLEEYQGRLISSVSASTCNRRFTSFKHFFNKCVEWEYLEKSPARHIKRKKETPNPRKTLTDDEVTRIASTLKPHVRHAFLLFAICGPRPGEGMSPQVRDWDKREGTLTVYSGKGAEGSRVIVLPEAASVLLDMVLSERVNLKPTDCIFLNTKGRPLKPAVLTRAVKKACKKLGIEDGKTPYGLRHTYATKLVRMDISSGKTRDLMGHKSIRTTEKYYKLDTRDLRETVNSVAKVFDFETGKEVGLVTNSHKAG